MILKLPLNVGPILANDLRASKNFKLERWPNGWRQYYAKKSKDVFNLPFVRLTGRFVPAAKAGKNLD